MGNVVVTLKRFLANKNTVTILGVLAGLIVLFVGYNYRVKSAISTMSVPVAKNVITARTQITNDMLTQMEVLTSMVNSKSSTIKKTVPELVNNSDPYCVAVGTNIPAGSFFYNDQVVKCNTINSNVLRTMPDGYRPVSLSVNLHSTYGNSMYPGDYIDLYAKMKSSDNKLIYAQLVSKLPILDVRDSSGNSVFSGTTVGTPAELLFAVPNILEEYNLYLLLSKAILLGSGTVELIPVPGNASYTTEVGETRVTSNYLMDLILSYTASIPDETVSDVKY